MSFIRFNHVFALLMLLSIVSAFVIPQRITGKLAAHVRGVFAPVSMPLHRVGTWFHSAFLASAPVEDRPEADVAAENDRLRTELVRLSKQLEDLQALNADRELLGDLRQHCKPLAVVGTDTGNRETLLLRPLVRGDLEDDLAVISPFGLVGKLDRVGAAAGPQVRLITDPGFRLEASFRRFIDAGNGSVQVVPLASTTQLVEGLGKGKMAIRNMTDRQVKEIGLQKGDWVVLSDREYDRDLQGLKIGRIMSIRPRPDAPQFAQIELEPMQNLKMLREVMVFERR
jgi:hypothetical protein